MTNPLGKCRVLIGRLPDTSTCFLKPEPTGIKHLSCGVGRVKQGKVSVFLDDTGNLVCYLNGKPTEDFTLTKI